MNHKLINYFFDTFNLFSFNHRSLITQFKMYGTLRNLFEKRCFVNFDYEREQL